MGVQPAVLVAELKKLRKGRGMQSPTIEQQIGPALREVCGIAAGDGPAVVRERLTERLGSLAGTLPPDLSQIVMVALGLGAEVQGQFLQERIAWLAQRRDRDVRTIRRRVDEGLARLAEAAATPRTVTVPEDEEGWHVQRFEAVLRLDMVSPTCFERRTIVADTDGVNELTILYTIPRSRGDLDRDHDMLVDIHYGARLVSRTRISDSPFRFVLRLPLALSRGASHEYGMIVRLPETQPMRPHYLYIPTRPCSRFDLRVRFPQDRAPAEVERVDGAFHREIDEPSDRPDVVSVDGVGEVLVGFRDLVPRLAYGLRWTLPEPAE